jgi:hypothetical protein
MSKFYHDDNSNESASNGEKKGHAKPSYKSSIEDRVEKLMRKGIDEKNIPVLPDHRTSKTNSINAEIEIKAKPPKIITKKIQTSVGISTRNFLSTLLGGNWTLLYDNDPSKNDPLAVNNSKVYRINGYTTSGVSIFYYIFL